MAGKIIKGNDPLLSTAEPSNPRIPLVPRRPGVVDADEFDARSRAREILAQAEAQAAEIRQRAVDERKQVLAEARERGKHEGLAQVGEILAKAQLEAGRRLEAAHTDIVKLSMKVAERIIGRELDARTDTILQIVAQAVDQVRQGRELVLRVNPQDAATIRTNKPRLMEKIGRLKDLSVREDSEIRRGGCVIETESGTIDAQLETQLELLERALLGDS